MTVNFLFSIDLRVKLKVSLSLLMTEDLGDRMLVLAVRFLVADIIAANLPKIADPGELVYTPEGIKLVTGGHPANMSVSLVKLDVPAHEITLIGAVGDDVFGDFIEEELRRHGLNVIIQRIKGVGTTKDMILVVKGEDRRFHVEVGATLYLDPDIVMKVLEESRPLIAYVGSGLNGRLDDELEEVLKVAKGYGSTTLVDLAKPYEKSWDFIVPSLRYADIFHCNDLELAEITRETNLIEGLKSIKRMGVKLPLITLGDRGAYASIRSDVVYMPAFKVRVIDPTGAGDAFCAGVIDWLLNNVRGKLKEGINRLTVSEVRDLLLWSQGVAAIKCTGVGTTTVSRSSTLELISEQGIKVINRTRIFKVT